MSAYVGFLEARSRLLEATRALVDGGELSMDQVMEEVDATKSAVAQVAFIQLMARPKRAEGRPVLRLVNG
jgi:hypothetical protein